MVKFENAKESSYHIQQPSAIMYFGPKDKSTQCCSLFYTPTKRQIENIKNCFGWDVEIINNEK